MTLAAGSGVAAPVVGMDVGGTKIAAILVDGDDRLLAQRSVPTDGRPLGEQVVAAARDLLDGLGADRRPAGIGIAVPGQVNSATGVVQMAVNLSLPPVPLAAIVGEGLGVPAFVDHDTRAAAAWLYQRSGGAGSLAYLSVGTGISAAVVVDGRLLRGVNGLAGEIGHLIAVDGGPPCACGLAGCLEAVAAGPAVA
ncbi:MAG: ROK family protein, partial [Candidatus Limnocylindria bacterium]